MSREEFLRSLEEALANEVPQEVIRDNVNYYSSYLSQEMARGRTVDEIVSEIGEPRIIARTIIDSYEVPEAGGQTAGYGGYRDTDYQSAESGRPTNTGYDFHYINLNKWYWKLLFLAISVLMVVLVFNIVGGVVAILLHFAGPILIVLMLVWFFRNMRR